MCTCNIRQNIDDYQNKQRVPVHGLYTVLWSYVILLLSPSSSKLFGNSIKDYFVSHSWGHPFVSSIATLSNFLQGSDGSHSTVFWYLSCVCFCFCRFAGLVRPLFGAGSLQFVPRWKQEIPTHELDGPHVGIKPCYANCA